MSGREIMKFKSLFKFKTTDTIQISVGKSFFFGSILSRSGCLLCPTETINVERSSQAVKPKAKNSALMPDQIEKAPEITSLGSDYWER